MSSLNVQVLYNGIEKLIHIELNYDNLYNSFLDIFRQKFGENDPSRHKFKLTTINTSIPYLLIDENNINNIIKEKIPNNEPLKILLTKEEDLNEISRDKRDSLDENFYCGYVKEWPKDEEDFNDDEFMILDEDNLKNIKNEIKIEENNEKEEEELENILSNSLNKEDNNNENNKNDINKIENIENENDTDNLDINLRLSYLNEEKNMNNHQNKKNISNKENDDKNVDKFLDNSLPVNPLNIPKNIFKSEVCSLCGNTMSSFKYICTICENCNLCEKCEDIHFHPCFKYKTKFMSNLTDTYKYIDKNYNYKIPLDSKKMTKLIRKEYNLKIVPMTDLRFSIRPNKIVDIPVKILNLSDHEINSSQFIVLIKNNKLINISYEVDKLFKIKPNDEYELRLLCRTSANFSTEKINIEIYSTELKIRMSSRLNFDLEIDINNDEEDEKINKELNNDKYAIFHSKMHKKIIISMIYFKEEWKTNLKKVCEVLRDNKWDINKSINSLTKTQK